MRIRPATITDLPQIITLLDALRKESVWGTLPIEPNYPHIHSKLMLILHDPRNKVVVAEFESNFPALDGQLIGVCRGALASHEYLPGLTYLAERDFYVMPTMRGMGIGKVLWKEMLRWGREQGAYGACYGKVTLHRGSKAVEQIIWRVFEKEPIHVGVD